VRLPWLLLLGIKRFGRNSLEKRLYTDECPNWVVGPEPEESGQKRMTHKGHRCSVPGLGGNDRVARKLPFVTEIAHAE